MHARSRAAEIAVALVAAACALWVGERIVAYAHGVVDAALSWRAASALLGLHVACVLAAAIATGAIARVHARSRSTWIAMLVAALVLALPAVFVGRALASGAWISMQWFAPLVAAAPPLAAAVLGALAVRFAFAPGRTPTLVLCALALVGMCVDASVAVGHFAAFHLAAWATVALAVTLVALRLVRARPRAWPRPLVWGTGAIAALALGSLALSSEATRAELLLRSPLSREVLRATRRAPTTRLHAELSDPALARGVPAGGAAFRPAPATRPTLSVPDDASVLVVTIDALRADALPPVRSGEREHARAGDTPNLDAFVASSVAFRHAYAPASFTMRSLPATFASRPALEDPERLVPALPIAMATAGRVPLAVVDRYFIEEPEGRALLEGFALVQVHASDDMKDAVGQMLALVDQTGGRPFFAWMHLFATHAPGYAGRPLTGRDGAWPVRYRRSVRWVDAQVQRLLDGLAERGLHESTIVVLSSDHGEGLGDNGIELHGESVFEEEVRVPLAIAIPGRAGATVDATVSLLDLAPTLLALIDRPHDPRLVGRSLVPLLAEPDTPWPYDVTTMSRRDSYALVRGRDKLVYDAGADVLLRFDLARDPEETHDRFGDDPALDTALRSAFVRSHPRLFARELEDPGTRALLVARLEAIDPARPPGTDALDFLLALCALDPDPDPAALAAALAPLSATDDATRVRIAAALLPVAPTEVGTRIAAHLRDLAGTPDELRFVRALAESAPPAFEPDFVAERLAWWVEHGEPDDAGPWLRLVATWSLEPEAFRAPIERLLAQALDADLLRSALTAAAGLRGDPASLEAIEGSARARLGHDDVGVRAAACTALGSIGTPQVLPSLAAALRRPGEDIRVRHACTKAAASAGGEAATELLIEQAGDPLLTFVAIRLLENVRSPAAIPFLRATIEREKRGRVHAAATSALRKTLAARPAAEP